MLSRFNFRVWDNKNNHMYNNENSELLFRERYIYLLYLKDNRTGIEFEKAEEIRYNKLNFVLMQSTGLEDKNSKEIFEGDIVKITGTNEIFPVKYYDNFCCFGLKVKQDGTRGVYYNLDKKIAKDIEVIGNIYENKELLEK